MKTRARVFLLLCMLILSYHLKAHVELDYPQGGETFIVGQTVIIQWHVSVPHILLNWDLFYSSDEGVTWDTLQMNIPPEQLTFEWEIPDELTSQGRIRIWMDNDGQDYVDISGNFTIAPNTMPPHLDAPAYDTLIVCSTNDQQVAIQNWLDNHGGMEVTNFCGDVVWSHDYTGLDDGCGASGTTDVTFTATDDCGYIESNATLTITDTQPPLVITQASDLVVESDGQGNISQRNAWLLNWGGGQVSDACSNVSWSHNFNGLSDGCGATGSATVRFTAVDACGNSVFTSATFAILDRTAPDIQIPANDTILECGSGNIESAIQEWLNNHAGAHATDLNGDISWSHNYAGLSDGCGATGNASVSFIASDVCGNIRSTFASVSVGDTAGLQMAVLPHDTIVDCSNGNAWDIIQTWLSDNGGARVTGYCGNVTWLNGLPQFSDSCNAAGIYVVSYTAVDECEQVVSAQATLTILDSLQTGIENLFDDDVKIFPNPASESLTIEFNNNNPGPAYLTLFDPYGKPVWSSDLLGPQVLIPVNHLSGGGVYFLFIEAAQTRHFRKVLIH